MNADSGPEADSETRWLAAQERAHTAELALSVLAHVREWAGNQPDSPDLKAAIDAYDSAGEQLRAFARSLQSEQVRREVAYTMAIAGGTS